MLTWRFWILSHHVAYMWLSYDTVLQAAIAAGNTCTCVVSSPDPTLKEGKGSCELWLNSQFSLYGAHRQGHANLGSNWSLWLYLHEIATGVKQILNLIGQLNWIAYIAIQRCCIPAVNLSCDWAELRSHWQMKIPQRQPKDSAQVHQTLFLLGGGDETTLLLCQNDALSWQSDDKLHPVHPKKCSMCTS